MKILNRIIKGYNLIKEIDNLAIQRNTSGLDKSEETRLEYLTDEYKQQIFMARGKGLSPKITLENWPEFVGRNIHGFFHPIKSLQTTYYEIIS